MATTMLDEAVDYLAEQLNAHTAREFTYERTNASDRANPYSLEVLATKTPRQFTEQKFNPEVGSFATVGRTQTWDFIVETAVLLLVDDKPTLPEIGDRIIEHGAVHTLTYEVAMLGGEKEWAYVDQNRKLLRLHTKLVRVENT